MAKMKTKIKTETNKKKQTKKKNKKKQKKKGKTIPVTGREGPYSYETLRLPHFL
jgi:hypothetical protein